MTSIELLIMYALKVTLVVLMLSLSTWVVLRFYGLSQVYSPYDHSLTKENKPWILAWGGELEDGPSHSREAFRGAANEAGVFLAINLEMNADKNFYGIPHDFKINNEVININNLSESDTKSLDLGAGSNPLRLEQILEEFNNVPILIWVNNNIENIDLRLEPILRKYQGTNRIIIHSEYDNVLKSIKKLIPDLLYGTGVGQRIRLLMLGSIGLESVSTVDGDILIAPLKEGKISTISTEVKDEIKRRQKVFILGPLTDIQSNNQAMNFGADGYLTSYARELKKKLKLSAQAL